MFRSGRTDGSDPVCTGYASSPACTGSAQVTRTNVTCERWSSSSRRFQP
jgi:hypothetical protein